MCHVYQSPDRGALVAPTLTTSERLPVPHGDVGISRRGERAQHIAFISHIVDEKAPFFWRSVFFGITL